MKNFIRLVNNSGTNEDQNRSNNLLRYTLPIMGFSFIFGIFGSNQTMFEGLAMLFGLIAISFGSILMSRPNLFSVVPISYKKRTLYYFLSILVVSVAIILAMAVIVLIIIGFVSLSGGFEESEEIVEDAVILCKEAVAFSGFRAIMLCFGLTAIATIRKLPKFLITFFVATIVYFLGGSIMTYMACGTFFIEGNLYENFANLPSPIAAVIICAVVTVAVVAGSIVFVLYQEKPKKY